MAYAMGRSPAKSHQEPELDTRVDPGTKAQRSKPGDSDLEAMMAPFLFGTEKPTGVRRLTGEWEEKGLNPTTKSKMTVHSPPPKANTRPRRTSPQPTGNTLAKMTSPTTTKAKAKESQPLEPRTSSTRRPSVEASTSPGKTGTKYLSRLTEAKAMMSKVRLQLNSSRNTSRAIIKEVMEAAERLMQLVGEAEAERRSDQKKAALSGTTKAQGEEGVEQDSSTRDVKGRDDEIIAKIEENNRLLKENERKMLEIRQIVEEQKEKIGKVTYASIVTEGKKVETKDRTNEMRTLHSIVVTSQDDMETGDEVLAKIRKAVDAKEGWIRVEKVRKAKDRKIIMGCNTREDREKIRQKIEKAGQSLVVEEMKNKDPLLVLKDVLAMHSDEEVLRALKNQNREVFHGLEDEESRIAIKYRKKTRNLHTNHIVVTVSPTIWGRARDQGRLRIDLQNVFVEDQSPLVQCSKCLGYGHGRRFCKAPADLCSHCGGPHLGNDCPDKVIGEAPTCINCKRAGTDNANHNAFSRECPVRRKWDSIARASIQYC